MCGEFHPFTNFLKEHGITQRVTCLHAYQQNESIECKHIHIVEMGLALLAQASMSLFFLEEAFEMAIYIINMIHSLHSTDKIPLVTKLFHVSPDYHFLKEFGCICFPFLRPFNKHKLKFRYKECLFLGYNPHHKEYKYLSNIGKIIISRYVLFNENSFRHNELFPCISSTTSHAHCSTVSYLIPRFCGFLICFTV